MKFIALDTTVGGVPPRVNKPVPKPEENQALPKDVMDSAGFSVPSKETVALPKASQSSPQASPEVIAAPVSQAPQEVVVTPTVSRNPKVLSMEDEVAAPQVESKDEPLMAGLRNLALPAQEAPVAAPAPTVPAAPAVAKVETAAVKRPTVGVLGKSWRAAQLLGNQLLSLVGCGDPVVALRGQLDNIRAVNVDDLKTPQAFQAKTAEFKARLANGETLADIQAEAYAVAGAACQQALGMAPYDEQMLGALAMDQGRISEMKTGEGKTMTAVMPAYLNALAGKGARIITANETLAQRDSKGMGKAYEMLGLSVGTVLESMTPEQKRAGYNADVTYLTNSTDGFDYLRDRSCVNPLDRVQRPPFFALIDEVDELLIDEARVPLILSQQAAPAKEQCQTFAKLVDSLVLGKDVQVDLEKHSAFLTESGQDRLENLLTMRRYQGHIDKFQARIDRAQAKSPDAVTKTITAKHLQRAPEALKIAKERLALVGQLDAAIVRSYDPENQADPAELTKLKAQVKEQVQEYNLYAPAHNHEVSFMQKAVDARALYRHGKDYTISLPTRVEEQTREMLQKFGLEDSEVNQVKLMVGLGFLEGELKDKQQLEPWQQFQPTVEQLEGALSEKAQGSSVPVVLDDLVGKAAQGHGTTPENLLKQVYLQTAELNIVDEFKGRVADGRRFSEGLHEALEAKEGLQVKAESKSIASITYPNLFRRYPRLSGMSGTAKVAEKEFQELYGLEVAVIPTHKPSKRVDEPDAYFSTRQEKYEAIVADAKGCYEKGQPVLIGTRSVEVNETIAQMLYNAGVPCQVLNADTIKHNTEKENLMLSRAGRSGYVTVASNMAGRGVDITEDKVAFKGLALTALGLVDPTCIELYEQDQQDPGKAKDWGQFLKDNDIEPSWFSQRIEKAKADGQSLPVVIDLEETDPAKGKQLVERLREWFGPPQLQVDKEIPFQLVEAGQNVPPQPGLLQVRLGVTPGEAKDDAIHLKASNFPTDGLRVLGSERHASRRIDLQLVGRTGRQGREGSSKFFLSPEDDLLHVYGSGGAALERARKIAGIGPGQGLSHSSVDSFINRAQEKVEAANYDARFNTTRFDGPMNRHRQLFFDFRESLVNSRPDVNYTSDDKLDVAETMQNWMTDALVLSVKQNFPEHKGLQLDLVEIDNKSSSSHQPQVVAEAVKKAAASLNLPLQISFDRKDEGPHTLVLDPSKKVKTEDLPGLLGPKVASSFDELRGELLKSGRVTADQVAKLQWETMVGAMDQVWPSHIEDMSSLIRAANLRSYEGKEPIQAYEQLAGVAYHGLVASFKADATQAAFKELSRSVQTIREEAGQAPRG